MDKKLRIYETASWNGFVLLAFLIIIILVSS